MLDSCINLTLLKVKTYIKSYYCVNYFNNTVNDSIDPIKSIYFSTKKIIFMNHIFNNGKSLK